MQARTARKFPERPADIYFFFFPSDGEFFNCYGAATTPPALLTLARANDTWDRGPYVSGCER